MTWDGVEREFRLRRTTGGLLNGDSFLDLGMGFSTKKRKGLGVNGTLASAEGQSGDCSDFRGNIGQGKKEIALHPVGVLLNVYCCGG